MMSYFFCDCFVHSGTLQECKAALFFMCMYFTLMLHVINQAINRWNQSIKHIQTIKQSTDASINQAIKQSISDAACVCVCVCACACGMFLLNVLCACACASKSNTTNQSSQSHQANMGYIQSTHTCMCISCVH